MSETRVSVRVEGRLGCVEVGNDATAATLDEHTVSSLSEAVYRLIEDPQVDRLALYGSPGHFVTGVDVAFFLECLQAGQIERILGFTRAANRVLYLLERSPKPVVAWVNGPAYGGGLELALACHRIVAGPKAKFCLPETGLGIYPGMGGTQRLPRRIGVGLAKWMIFTGAIVPADHALAFGLVDAVAAADANAFDSLAALGPSPDLPSCEPRFRTLAEYFAHQKIDALLDPACQLPKDPALVRAIVQTRSAAPRALQLAEAAIDIGITLPLAAALDEESSRLAEVFATQDAQTGLSSVGKAKPKYTGT